MEKGELLMGWARFFTVYNTERTPIPVQACATGGSRDETRGDAAVAAAAVDQWLWIDTEPKKGPQLRFAPVGLSSRKSELTVSQQYKLLKTGQPCLAALS